MKLARGLQSSLLLVVLVGSSPPAVAQSKKAPHGFDQRHKGVEAGKVHKVEYDSKTVGARRKMVVYTPPGYSSRQKYPVLYLMHGLGGDQTDWTKNDAEVILDNLHAHKKIVPMIVVMPDNRSSAHPHPPEDKREESEEYNRFEGELLGDVIPFVESHYPAIAEPRGRALAGLSMGGGQALNIGLKHPDTFTWVGAFSAGGIHSKQVASLLDHPASAKPLRLLWISCGDKDSDKWGHLKKLHEDLELKGVPHVWYVDAGGEHVWPVWKNDLYWMSQRLFR